MPFTVHTARDFSDFPLDRMFREDDPYFLNVKQLARGYEEYAKKHNLVRRVCCRLRGYSLIVIKEHLDEFEVNESLLQQRSEDVALDNRSGRRRDLSDN